MLPPYQKCANAEGRVLKCWVPECGKSFAPGDEQEAEAQRMASLGKAASDRHRVRNYLEDRWLNMICCVGEASGLCNHLFTCSSGSFYSKMSWCKSWRHFLALGPCVVGANAF